MPRIRRQRLPDQCLYVWLLRKSHAKSSWIGFFATTTAVLIFITLPTIMAVLLPMIDFMNNLMRR